MVNNFSEFFCLNSRCHVKLQSRIITLAHCWMLTFRISLVRIGCTREFPKRVYIFVDSSWPEKGGRSLIKTINLVSSVFPGENLRYFWPNVISIIPDSLAILTTFQITFLVTYTVQAKLKVLIEQVLSNAVVCGVV